jgi:hypothetical protein
MPEWLIELVVITGGLSVLCFLVVWWVVAFANAVEREAREYRKRNA